AARLARHLLLDGPLHHAAAGDLFLVRHALAHLAGGLVRDPLLDADRVGFRVAPGHALAHGHLVGFAARLLFADRDALLNRTVLAHPLDLGAGLVDPHLAGDPDLLGLRLGALAAGVTRVARVAAAALLAAEQTLAAGHFPALPVSLVNALLLARRHFLANPVLLHADTLLDAGDAHTECACARLDRGDFLVHRTGARPRFRNANTLVRCIFFANFFRPIHSPGGRVVF